MCRSTGVTTVCVSASFRSTKHSTPEGLSAESWCGQDLGVLLTKKWGPYTRGCITSLTRHLLPRVTMSDPHAATISILNHSWQDRSTCSSHELRGSSTQGCLVQKQPYKQDRRPGGVPHTHIARVAVHELSW